MRSRRARASASLYAAASHFLPLRREPLRSIYNAAYFAYKRFEDPYARLLRERPDLLAGGNVVDAGANIGYDTILFASHLAPQFRVHAFEPEPENVKLLQRNVRRSAVARQIVVHPIALGSRTGTTNLKINQRHPGDHQIVAAPSNSSVSVDMTTIDEAMRGQPVSLIKIDVQGYELEVSRGMDETLRANPDVRVAFEFAPASLASLGVNPDALLDFYTTRGFRMALVDRSGLLETTAGALQSSVRGEDYVDVICWRQ
ncbi:MAG TPA: FkbM family methyltransferase [Thermoanaerobaculia bacterium]